MRLYANIAKVEPQEDGTLKVYGFASSAAEDSDGETVAPDAMKAAIPDYMKFGAVREMHQPLAAGTALDIGVDADGKTNFGAHIVDPVAVKKVQTQVYKGFSIGGKVTSRDPLNNKHITGLRLVEVSLVDRPANPDAVFTMYKAEKLEDEPAPAADDPNAHAAGSPLNNPVVKAAAAAEPSKVEPKGEAPAAKPALADIEKAAVAEIAKMLNDKKILPSQILKASQEAIAPKEPRKAIALADFKKGMYSVSCFASLLQSAACLATDAAYEAEYEADSSVVPEGLRAWVSQGVAIFNTMAAEESAELLAAIKQLPAEAEISVIESGDKTGDLSKKGATFSDATKKKLGDIHKSMKDCCDKMDSLGYKQDDDAGMAEAAEAIAAAAGASPISKTEEPGDLFKAELAKRDAVIDALAKRLEVIEAQPMPAKGVLKTLTKGEDVLQTSVRETEVSKLPSNATPEQLAKAQTLDIFRTGGRRIA